MSQALGISVWFTLSSELVGIGAYRGRCLVWCYSKWLIGDTITANVGELTESSAEHWGNVVAWDFSTIVIYNEAQGAVFHEIELIALTGRGALGVDPTIWAQYSNDGEVWSIPKPIKAGKNGERRRRLVWLAQGASRNWRIQRFHGTSDAMLSMAALEIRLEPLAV